MVSNIVPTGHRNTFIGIIASIAVAGILTGILYAIFPIPLSNSASVLSALFTAQASILAIVFSLTYIGIQITAPEYSPRLTWVFAENLQFRFTFLVFGISMLFNIGGLILIPLIPSAGVATLLVVALGLATAAFYEVYRYFREGMNLATPDGIIDQYRRRMTSDHYLQQIQDTADDEFDRRHPFRGLLELVEKAYAEEYPSTGAVGTRLYCSLLKTAMDEQCQEIKQSKEYRSSGNVDMDDPRSSGTTPQLSRLFADRDLPVADLFGHPFESHLPELGVLASEHDFETQAGEIPDSHEELSETAEVEDMLTDEVVRQFIDMEDLTRSYGAGDLLVYIHRGMMEYYDRSRRSGNTYAATKVWTEATNCLETLGQTRPVGFVAPIVWEYHQSITAEPMEGELKFKNRDEYFRAIAALHSDYLKYYEGTVPSTVLRTTAIEEFEFDYQEGLPREQKQVRADLHMLFCSFSELTARVLRESDGNTSWANQLITYWSQFVQSAVETDAPKYAIGVCQAMIETAVLTQLMEAPSTKQTTNWKRWVVELQELQRSDDYLSAAFMQLEARSDSQQSESPSKTSPPKSILEVEVESQQRYHDLVSELRKRVMNGDDNRKGPGKRPL